LRRHGRQGAARSEDVQGSSVSILTAISNAFEVLPPLPPTADPLRRLVEQFRGKPRIEALLRAIAAQVQQLEDVATDLLEKRWLDTAEGAQLDGLGRLLGHGRVAWDAEQYRARLLLRARLRLPAGPPASLVPALAPLSEGPPVQLTEP